MKDRPAPKYGYVRVEGPVRTQIWREEVERKNGTKEVIRHEEDKAAILDVRLNNTEAAFNHLESVLKKRLKVIDYGNLQPVGWHKKMEELLAHAKHVGEALDLYPIETARREVKGK